MMTQTMRLQGAIRGKSVKPTVSDKAAPYPLDHVNRQFETPKPNVLWLADFTSRDLDRLLSTSPV